MKRFILITVLGLSSLILHGCGNDDDNNTTTTPTTPTTTSNQLSTIASTSTNSDAQTLEATQLSSDITTLFGSATAEPVDVADTEDLSAVITRVGGQP